jgi:hypothetical protein
VKSFRRFVRPGLLCLLPLLAPAAFAQVAPEDEGQSAETLTVDAQVTSSSGFLYAHPDLRFRVAGQRAWEAGDYARALTLFKQGARFADKPSQGMIGELLWNGQGTPVDRPLAQAWMRVAAERGYAVMVINRDRYWREMSADERARADALVPALLAEYGDAVAKPRIERRLRQARNSATGSRLGSVGSGLQVQLPGPAGTITLDGSQFFQQKFWDPKAYWAWQAQTWQELPKGQVRVGPLDAKASAHKETARPLGRAVPDSTACLCAGVSVTPAWTQRRYAVLVR